MCSTSTDNRLFVKQIPETDTRAQIRPETFPLADFFLVDALGADAQKVNRLWRQRLQLDAS